MVVLSKEAIQNLTELSVWSLCRNCGGTGSPVPYRASGSGIRTEKDSGPGSRINRIRWEGAMKACLYEPLKHWKVQCYLCSHRFVISEGQRGLCCVRENQEGVLKSLVYGRLIAGHVDPIEKKPFFHFSCLEVCHIPSQRSAVIFHAVSVKMLKFLECLQIRMGKIPELSVLRRRFLMKRKKPVARALHTPILSRLFFLNLHWIRQSWRIEEDSKRICHQRIFDAGGAGENPSLSGWRNVDLKAFREKFYKEVCGASLKPVQKTLTLMKSMGIHLEITTLLIPGMNDDPVELSPKWLVFCPRTLDQTLPGISAAFIRHIN